MVDIEDLVFYTQYRENYGAHDWDGVGDCPQYWKNKGGDAYILRGYNKSVHGSVPQVIQKINAVSLKSDDYSDEFVCDVQHYKGDGTDDMNLVCDVYDLTLRKGFYDAQIRKC